ncbi:MAG: ABC transporter permease [Prolixibacteraceae bacterium]|nr:ABC transporter permease [Prolixibacteraceae bacterium]
MLLHHILIIYRKFKQNKSSFFINLLGLSIGLACALLIYLWVNDELHVDKFNKNDNRIFQVMQNYTDGNEIQTWEYTQGILARALAEEIPEIQYAATVVPASWFDGKGTIKLGETSIKADGQYATKDYLNIFSCDLVVGNKNQVLTDKYSVAISEELAGKLFVKAEKCIGKTIEWNQDEISGLFQITGIFKSPPANATAQFDLLFNYDIFQDAHPWLAEWGNSDPSTFVVVQNETDVSVLNAKIKNFLKSKSQDSGYTLFLQKYSDRYLYSRYENGQPSGGRIEYIRLFSIVAIFILIIACINFMNLSTAKASGRFKEIGIKKAVGANRAILIYQHLGESMLMTLISLMLSIGVVVLFLPYFNEITGKQLVFTFGKELIFSIVGILLFTGLVAGSYPALYLSGFRPVEVLKGKLRGSVAEFWARKGLVIFQFVISVTLIVSVLVVYKQIEFVQSKNLGYNRDNILHFNAEMKMEDDENFFAYEGKLEKNVETLLNEINNIPGVVSVSNFNHDLTGNHGDIQGVDWTNGDDDVKMHFSNLEIGNNFIETLGIEMLEGRSFSSESGNEISKIIFNEEAIKQMGLIDPIGKTIRVWGQEKQIIGITKNFHFESLFEEVKPCIIQLEPRAWNMIVKVNSESQSEAISQLQKLFQARNPGLAFEYKFVDDDYQALYVAEKRVSILSKYFAGIAILISCLGLFGLATFSAEKRKKEISVRKILGAGEYSIVQLLSNEFTKMVLTAIFIALPLSYLIVDNWIKKFAYRINISWWIFALAGLLALGIALLTVSWQSWRAATRNPVEALRYE